MKARLTQHELCKLARSLTKVELERLPLNELQAVAQTLGASGRGSQGELIPSIITAQNRSI